jgi:hypothetical protein
MACSCFGTAASSWNFNVRIGVGESMLRACDKQCRILTNRQGVHWMVLAAGFGLFGFTFVLASGIALAYVTDCYQEVSRKRYAS